MSMEVLTILQIAEAFMAYGLVALLLPAAFLHRQLKCLSAPEQLLLYFLVGNFYLIALVFALQLLHLSGRITLVLGTLLPFGLGWFCTHKAGFEQEAEQRMHFCLALLQREVRPKVLLLQRYQAWNREKQRTDAKSMVRFLPELVLLAALAAALCYVYGVNIVSVWGYKASDVVVHNVWINSMDQNRIFEAGVYPHGFHCVLYYLETVFGIDTYILLRVFAFVQTAGVHLAMLVSLKLLCKNRYTPYFGTLLYVLLKGIDPVTYLRFNAALPQEHGMLYILPAGALAIRLFQEYALECGEKTPEQKQVRHRRVQWYLLGFLLSVSLTLTVHFYDAIIAGMFCAGIAIGFLPRFVQWKYFRQIIAAGLVGILLAVLPMAVGVLQGNKLQGSLYWALRVVQSEAAAEGAPQTERSDVAQDGAGTPVETLRSIWRRSVGCTAEYITQQSAGAAAGMLGCIALVLAAGVGCLLLRQTDYGMMLCSAGWFAVLLTLMLAAGVLQLPVLMQPDRAGIFFCYARGVLWSLVLDAAVAPLHTAAEGMAYLAIAASLCGIMRFDLLRSSTGNAGFEANQSILCVANILQQEPENYQWTICSANDERNMILRYGRHVEMITFLRALEEGPERAITIPTRTVYFFIEKQPLYLFDYSGAPLRADEMPGVSAEGAGRPLAQSTGNAPYTIQRRWVTMSHMYYWAQAFRRLYPNEMTVYYEDDGFVCYKLEQNVNSLYDLNIDYGYNR